MFIEIKDLYKKFNSLPVLKGVNLQINKGETIAIIGRSGCGKSVLLKHIMGLLKPDSGNILVDGVDIKALREHELNEYRKRFGMLFQGAALFDSLTVKGNVAFGLMEHVAISKEEIDYRVKEYLGMVGMTGVEDKKPAELSGGMRKRVGLARAIAMDPEFILYDEPTTGIDPIMGDIINDLILKLHDQLKVTSIVVTHDMVSAFKVADRIAMLYGGKIIFAGTPEEIQETENEWVKQFVSGSAEGPINHGDV